MLLFNEKLEVSAGSGAQQVPCGMYELSTPVITSFDPSLDAIFHGADLVPSPSNIYDSSQLMDFAHLDDSFLTALKPQAPDTPKIKLEALELGEEESLFYSPQPQHMRVKVEPVQDTAQLEMELMEELVKEMDNTCSTLYITRDPYAWSREDVHKWMFFTLEQNNMTTVNLDYYFDMNGPELCGLTEDYFRTSAGPGGEKIYTQLYLWKETAGLYRHGVASPPPAFQPEDSLLDISACLHLPTQGHVHFPGHAHSPGHALSPRDEGSDQSQASDVLSQIMHSDYSSDGGLLSDDDISEDGLESREKLVHSSVGVVSGRQGAHSHIHLWQFLKELLTYSQTYGSCIRWLDKDKGVFKIEDSVRVARLWGKRKNRPAMNYDKLSRSIRQYYKKGIMKKTERSQRLVYQFCHPYCM